MEIIEGNKLIAEFMGDKPMPHPYNYEVNCFYHCKWDWLMPVVEKIEKFDEGVCSVFIAGTDCDIAFSSKYNKDGEDYDAPNFRKSSEDKMKSTWQAVVQFIQWYNTQPLTPVK